MDKNINFIEKAILNSIPSKVTVLCDDWILRLNGGFTYRADCVCPFNYENTVNINEKIKYCEKIFNNNDLPCVFKVSPDVQKGMSEILEDTGYKKIKTVNVMTGTLKNEYIEIPEYIKIQSSPDDKWLNASAKLSGIDEKFFYIHCSGIKNIAVDSVFVSAVVDDKIVGCAYGTCEKDFIGIYDLHVDNNYRKRGIGNSLCDAVLSYGKKQNVHKAYLLVHSLNDNAIKLYEHRGFKKNYEYYFYEKQYNNCKIVD